MVKLLFVFFVSSFHRCSLVCRHNGTHTWSLCSRYYLSIAKACSVRVRHSSCLSVLFFFLPAACKTSADKKRRPVAQSGRHKFV